MGVATIIASNSGGGRSSDFPLDFSGQTITGRTFAAGEGFAYDLACFSSAELTTCIFTGRFQAATFYAATLTGCTLTGDFSGCDFQAAGLVNCTFTGNFTGCNFLDCSLDGCTLNGNFTGCDFSNQSISTGVNIGAGSDFTGCNFTNSSFFQSSADMHGAIFVASTLKDLTFDGANVKGCNFTGCVFLACSFVATDFTVVGTAVTFLSGCSFIFGTLDGCLFTGADLSGATFFESGYTTTPPVLSGCNFTGANFCNLATGAAGTEAAVIVHSGSYTALAWDANKLLSFSAAATLSLPAVPPSNTWQIAAQNASTGALVIDPGSLRIDGASGTATIAAGGGVEIYTDGTNYFTRRSGAGGVGVGSTPVRETPSGALNGTNAVFTLSFTPISLMLVLNGVVQDPVVDYSISGVTITFVVAPLASDWMLAYYSH